MSFLKCGTMRILFQPPGEPLHNSRPGASRSEIPDGGWRQCALEREPEHGAGRLRQQLERTTVGVGELPRDIQAEPRAAGTGGEERLENLRTVFHRHAGTVVGELADDR